MADIRIYALRVYKSHLNHRGKSQMLTRWKPSRRLAACALMLVITPLWAGLRGPGKYSGVVFFDRWGTCMLLSGPYLTYISESVKDKLRPYVGEAIQINASKVFQSDNPGDGLVRAYTVIGPAPAPQFIKLDGIDLRLSSVFTHRDPHFLLTIRNDSSTSKTVLTDQIGITVLGKSKFEMGPSDGPSVAVITRSSVFHVTYASEWRSHGQLLKARFTVVGETVMPDHIELRSRESKTYDILLQISPGQYQFVFGYGGGIGPHEEASLISNAISFNVSPNGVASITK